MVAVTQAIARIKSGAKIESVLSIKGFRIVLNVTKIVEKDYYQRSNLMDLRFLSKDMGLKNYWIV